MLEFHVGRQSISKGLKMLDRLGMIEVEAGPRCSNRFRFSNRWRSIDKVEAARLAALAREVLPHRRFSKPPELKPVKPPKTEANNGRATARHAPHAVAGADAVAGWTVRYSDLT